MLWIRRSSNMITLYDVYYSTEYICYNIVRCLQFDRAHTSKHCTIFWIRQSTHFKTLHDVLNSTEYTYQNIARCFEFDRAHISKHCTIFWQFIPKILKHCAMFITFAGVSLLACAFQSLLFTMRKRLALWLLIPRTASKS